MKIFQIIAGTALLAFSCAGFSQSDVSCGQTLEAPLRISAVLKIDSQPSGIEIVGSDRETIHVSCSVDDADKANQIRLRLSGSATNAKLVISGSHPKNGNLRIHVEVPRKTNLGIRMSAGQVKVDEIVGDKDIELYAGQVTISSAHKWDYKNVDVSVGVGQVNAQVYSTEKGGFFRAFHKQDPEGDYRLRAHVTTGQIELLGKSAETDANQQ